MACGGFLRYVDNVMAYAIDTLAGAKDLERAGVPDKQAEAIVHLITQQGEGLATKTDITALQSEMATKADLAALENNMATKADLAALDGKIAALDGKIAALDGRVTTLQSNMATKTDLAEMKVTLLQAMVGGIGLVIAAVVAVNKLF